MKGSEFVKTLPKRAGPEREKMILDAVRRRDIAPITWSPIMTECTTGGGFTYTATILASKDAVRVGDASDSIRVTTGHETAQRIADELGVALPTPMLSDQIWAQAVVRVASLPHNSWVQDKSMALTRRMVDQSNLVDKRIVAAQQKDNVDGLIADVGKDWVTTIRHWQGPPPATPTCPDKGPIRSANYGWHANAQLPYTASTPAGKWIWQPIGRCHTMLHADYSQPVRLIRRDVIVCGPGMGDSGCATLDIAQIATDPALACLVSHEGALPAFRHPAVKPSCEPDVRCPQVVFQPGVSRLVQRSASSCPLECEELPGPGPDPTARAGPSSTSYFAFALAAAAGFAGVMWFGR